jgi:ASPIC and UnbV/FG-GAP-like repeat
VAAGSLDYSFWGTAVSTDFDNDGIADIIMNGKYYLKVLRGTGGGNFTYMNTTWGIRDTSAASVDDGLSFGDIDGDGDLDIIGYDETFPTRTLKVYRNDSPPNNWLNIRPIGPAGNINAPGAKISIYAPGTNQLLWYEQVATYDFQVATSYYGRGQTERHFGLGTRSAVDVVVEFPSSRTTRINNVAANQTIPVFDAQSNPPASFGDFNQNGQVDSGDYVVWRNTQGMSVAPYSGADGNGDGIINNDDYTVWRGHFGMVLPASGQSSSAVAPTSNASTLQIHEPASLLSLEATAPPAEMNATAAQVAGLAMLDIPTRRHDTVPELHGQMHRFWLAESGSDVLLLLAIQRTGSSALKGTAVVDDLQRDDVHADDREIGYLFDEWPEVTIKE